MSVFKLVLCLTGLAIYLVVKQFVAHRTGDVLPPSRARHTTSPQPVQGQPEKRSLKPQTTPHTEVMKPSREWA